MMTCKDLKVRLRSTNELLFIAPSLRFRPGERYAIMGPSGCGKSVLTKYLAGLLPKKNNDILFFPATPPKVSSLLYLPQDSRDSVLPWRNTKDVFKNNEDLLQTLGLKENFNKRQYPKRMSGGELRRLALGELLTKGERSFIILDEPLNGLDEDLRSRCTKAIKDYTSRFPSTCLIFVTHYQQEREQLKASLVHFNNEAKEFAHE